MKSQLIRLFSFFILTVGLSITANATLIDRGNGMIYDSAQDITWLQDANYAMTSGYDADGLMDWNAATAWADSLVYGGFDDWRLASVTDVGNDGCNWSFVGGTDCGFNVDPASSELAYMWYSILGHTAFSGLTFTSADGVDILNLQSGWYWSGTEYAPDTSSAWTFSTDTGQQGSWPKTFAQNPEYVESYAWAVRSGDVAASKLNAVQTVTEPGSLLLLSVGLLGVAAFRRLHV